MAHLEFKTAQKAFGSVSECANARKKFKTLSSWQRPRPEGFNLPNKLTSQWLYHLNKYLRWSFCVIFIHGLFLSLVCNALQPLAKLIEPSPECLARCFLFILWRFLLSLLVLLGNYRDYGAMNFPICELHMKITNKWALMHEVKERSALSMQCQRKSPHMRCESQNCLRVSAKRLQFLFESLLRKDRNTSLRQVTMKQCWWGIGRSKPFAHMNVNGISEK
jgi:hypothetical protein